MLRIFTTFFLILFLCTNVYAGVIRLDEEGTSQGYIANLNFAGAGSTAARTGITGTVTIDVAGAEADTLDTVCDRLATTDQTITLTGATAGIYAQTGASGILTLGGAGGSNNENLTFDFETAANYVDLGGVANLSLDAMHLYLDGDKGLSMSNAYFRWRTMNDTHAYYQLALACGAGTGTGVFSLIDYTDKDSDNRKPATYYTDPRFRVYSGDATSSTDFIELYHNQTDGYIISGTGTINLDNDNLTTTGTIEGATLTEGGSAILNATELEGTAILSTGEGGGTKYLREDGDNTCSWQTPAGAGDLLADGSVPMTSDWDIGNYDITLKSLTGDGTIEGATLTEGGAAVYSAGEIIKKRIYISATAGVPRTDNGCADAALSETSTNKVNYYTCDFDASSDEFWQAHLTLPENYDASTFTYSVSWTCTADAAKGVAWFLQLMTITNDDALDTAYGTAVESNDDGTTTGDYLLSPESSAVTASGSPAGGDELWIQLYRDVSDADDDLTTDGKFMGVWLTFGIDALSTED